MGITFLSCRSEGDKRDESFLARATLGLSGVRTSTLGRWLVGSTVRRTVRGRATPLGTIVAFKRRTRVTPVIRTKW